MAESRRQNNNREESFEESFEDSKNNKCKGINDDQCESSVSEEELEGAVGHQPSRGRYLSTSSGSDDDQSRKNDSDKRLRVDASPHAFIISGLAASPPRFVSLEQIMKAANGVTNMALAHEIAVDKDFKFEKVEPPENSLERQMKEIIHKAFWDAFREQLNEIPPNYQHAMILLNEIKEGLLSLLLPHHTRVKEEINEVLDVELIRHQAENDALDFHYYAKYIISFMAKLCAPIRDEKIRQFEKITDVVDMYREILQTLDVMKLDMANFTIQQLRPHIQQHSIEYEKKKFAEFLETQTDGLEFTREWFRRILTEDDNNKSSSDPTPTNALIMKAYMSLLEWDDKWSFPETLLMDHTRFIELRNRVENISLVASMLLVTFSTVGPNIAGLTQFKEQLKQHVTVLLNTSDVKGKLNDATANVAVQVVKEVNECLVKHGFKELDESGEKNLKGQIEELAVPNARICTIVKQRILEFINLVLTATGGPLRVPPRLSTMQPELARITGQFLRLVSHNRAVFGDYYVDIIQTMREKSKNGVVETTQE